MIDYWIAIPIFIATGYCLGRAHAVWLEIK